ncbi:MAG: type I-E CRISPR-associated protein Cas5/CasD [Deltaproteobacteria bacterium]|nr:type I-E CRISPR-associated protein Cas5/CasD [Deltaproteobacteria bacterium]
MHTQLRGVAIRLHGPLQAWGGAAIGDSRPTLPFPTRSGVLGLVAASLGIPRRDEARLLALADGARVHVRVDAPGVSLVDDQTIQGNPKASSTRQTIQSKRTYLCDASFVAVIVPGAADSTAAIAHALRHPAFAPFLGRRSCAPSTPLLLREVVADEPIALFADIPRGPEELLAALRSRAGTKVGPFNYYLDVDDYPGALRRIPVRDNFAGPLPRQYRERFTCHVQTPAHEA